MIGHAAVGVPTHSSRALPLSATALLAHAPALGSQASVVHGLPSSHGLTAPPMHAPLLHKAPLVQGLPSSQALLFGT